MSNDKKNPKRVITPKFRLSFPELFEAKAFAEAAPKFSLQMLFDKGTDLTPLKKAVQLAAKEKWGDQMPKGLVLPFKDGDEKEIDGYEGMIVVAASSKFKPQVVDAKLQEILTPDDIYAGCFARAAISAYAWEYGQGGKIMKRGVSFNLENVQKLAEGERFVKRSDASDDFDMVDSDTSSVNDDLDDDMFS